MFFLLYFIKNNNEAVNTPFLLVELRVACAVIIYDYWWLIEFEFASCCEMRRGSWRLDIISIFVYHDRSIYDNIMIIISLHLMVLSLINIMKLSIFDHPSKRYC